MRGIFHLTLSTLIGLLIFWPFLAFSQNGFLPSFLSLLLIITIMWGSLVPDIDTTGHSMIFYDYPYVASFFRYAIYKPLTFVFKENKHRGFMHSLEGALLTDLLFSGYIILGILGLFSIDLLIPTFTTSLFNSFASIEKMKIDFFYIVAALIIVNLGLFTGIVLHLFEDSLTVSGINWKWRGINNWHISGGLRVGNIYENVEFSILLTEAGIFFLIQYAYIHYIIFIIIFIPIELFIIILSSVLFQKNQFLDIMKIIFGADVNEFDANTRQIAQEKVNKIKLANGKFLNVERIRIVRGLHIP